MPFMNGAWRDSMPYITRQFVFTHQVPIPNLPYTVIPDDAARRIVGNFTACLDGSGCWGYGSQRVNRPRISFIDPEGRKQSIAGNRFGILLLNDVPIPPGATANHSCENFFCTNPLHLYSGTQSQNQLDAYVDGRRTRGPSIFNREDHEQHQRDRLERQRQRIRCSRFFCDEILDRLGCGREIFVAT